MQAHHLPQVLAVERAANAHPWSEANLRDSLQAGYSGWVLFDDHERVIGYAILMIAVGEAQVLNIVVSPERRREGLGRVLMETMIEAANAAHCELMLLEVRRSNVAAIALYRAYGFEQIGLRRNYYRSDDGVGEDAFVLSLPLRPATRI